MLNAGWPHFNLSFSKLATVYDDEL